VYRALYRIDLCDNALSPNAEIVVYSRRGCHLCELLLEELDPLVRGRARIVVRDVDERAQWRDEYGLQVPVVWAGGAVLCHYHLDKAAVTRWLAARSV
jgi:hypothetical protein